LSGRVSAPAGSAIAAGRVVNNPSIHSGRTSRPAFLIRTKMARKIMACWKDLYHRGQTRSCGDTTNGDIAAHGETHHSIWRDGVMEATSKLLFRD